jgi:glycosyltransferase involved in cell wall biosynthesis
MDRELAIDFVFGDKHFDVKKMDYSQLNNFKKEVKNRTFIHKPITFQSGVIPLLKDYSTFIMLSDLHCVSTWLMLLLAKLFRKDVYLWSHGWYGKEGKLKILIKKIYFGLAKGTFLYGNYAKNLMKQSGLNADKLYVIHNSLMFDEHLSLRKQLKETLLFEDHFNNTNKNLIFIGRLTEQKRLDILFEALSELSSIGFHYNLTIIGTGEKESALKKLSEKMKMNETTWFYGECYDEKIIAELIFNADLCVSPGNVGLTAIHSLTFGTPVITHNNFPLQMPEFEAIEEGKTGSFFEYNSVASLSQSVVDWFSFKHDRNEIRKNCYDMIDKKWNPYYQIEVFKQVLND